MAGAFEQAWAVLKSDPRMQAFTEPVLQRRHPDLTEHHGIDFGHSNLGTIDPNAISMALSEYLTPIARLARMQGLMDPAKNLGYDGKYDSRSPVNLTGKRNWRSAVYAEDPTIPPTFVEGGFEGPVISRMSRPTDPYSIRARRDTPQGRIDHFIHSRGREPTDEELDRLLQQFN